MYEIIKDLCYQVEFKNSKTLYWFQAVKTKKPDILGDYRINETATTIRNDEIKAQHNGILYFKDKKEMLEEFNKFIILCKKSEFTKNIIIK